MFTTPARVVATAKVRFRFTVAARGYVTPTFRLQGTLPKGVSFVDKFDGSATLSGTPTVAGTYREKVVATFAYGTAVRTITQSLVLTVH